MSGVLNCPCLYRAIHPGLISLRMLDFRQYLAAAATESSSSLVSFEASPPLARNRLKVVVRRVAAWVTSSSRGVAGGAACSARSHWRRCGGRLLRLDSRDCLLGLLLADLLCLLQVLLGIQREPARSSPGNIL